MLKYSRKISYETLISRIPGMFAYIEDNKLGVNELHSAYDAKMGCYGKIVQNMVIPYDAIDSEDGILLSAGTHTYREMMDCYYSHKDTLNSEFVDFVERGIGRISVPFEAKEGTDLIPEFVYLGAVQSMYDEYVTMSKQCEFYQNRIEKDGTDPQMCCLCERYERMGGDEMRDWLEALLSEAESRANEYLAYADSDKPLSIKIDIILTSSLNDLGLVTPYIEEWEAGKTYYEDDRVYYDGDTYTANKETHGDFNEQTEKIEFPIRDFDKHEKVSFDGVDDEFNVEGQCDGKLKSLRRYVEYLNTFDETETPDIGEDWLFYYRIGYITGIETMNDDFGNILRYDKNDGKTVIYYDNTNIPTSGEQVENLFAYGNLITNITADAENNEITFSYVLGAHLLANFVEYELDDDGNYRCKYNNFVVDESDKAHWVIYKSVFSYEKESDLEELVNDSSKFNDYINGLYDLNGGGDSIDIFTKYEFKLYNHSQYYWKRIGYEGKKIYTDMADFTATIENEYDREKANVFRYDYYSGISYQPTIETDVYIDRGDTTAFEKHIKLSEVKTLQDMEEYSNGSFFKML